MSWLFSKALMEDYVNSLSSPEQVAGFLEVTSLDGEQFAQLNVMPTPQPFWRNDKMMDVSDLSRFGLTSRPLTADRGMALLTSFLAGFHAKTSAQPARGRASAEREVGCGATWRASLAKYSPDTRSWKTAQCSLLEDSELYLETWPRWGSMQNGVLYLRPTPALPTLESESGFWPTPNVPNGGRSTKHITDWRGKSAYHNGKKVQVGLESVLGGAPHPTFLEWLMGWPIGWTDTKPLEMDKFREWQQQHGGFLANETPR